MSDMRRASRSNLIRPVDGFRLTDKQVEVNRLIGGPQTHTLIYGGGRSGKTFLIVRAIIIRALRAPGSQHAIIRHRFNHVVRSIGGENGTLPEVLKLCFPGLNVSVDRTQWIYTLPNGSQIYLLGLDEKNRAEKVLGSEFSTLYFNEASQIKYSAYTLALSRLVEKAKIEDADDGYLKLRAFVDLNPAGKTHWTYQLFIAGVYPDTNGQTLRRPGNYKWAVMNPGDNRENLAAEALEELENLPEAERIRFFEGRYVDEVDGALFKLDWIANNRVTEAKDLQRIIVSVDPSGSAAGDECGIIVAGRRNQDHYVLADHSGKMSPTEASELAIRLHDEYEADAIVIEKNFGGDWLTSTVNATARDMNQRGKRGSDHIVLETVTARRGKVLRAEPVGDLYSLGRVHHMGTFRLLEDQMTSFSINWDRDVDGSPDRLDALTMAITSLQGSAPSVSKIGVGRVKLGRR